MPYLAFLFICAVWGGSFILMDRALLAMGPLAIGVSRLLSGATVLAAYCTWTRRWTPISLSDWRRLCFVALLANGVPYVIQPMVMRQAGQHGYFGLMVALVPIATILVSIPMLGRYPTRRQAVGVIGGLGCVVLIVVDGNQRGISWTMLAMAISVPLSYAVGNTYIKWKLDHLPAAPMSALFLGIAGLCLTPLLASPNTLDALGVGAPPAPREWGVAISAVLTLGMIGTGVSILAFTHLIKTQGPLFASMVTYVVPLIALMWGRYDSEPLTWLQLTAMGGVLAMVAWVQWGAARP